MKIVSKITLFDNFEEDTIYMSARPDDPTYYRLFNNLIYKYTLNDKDYTILHKNTYYDKWMPTLLPKDDLIVELFSFILMEQLL